MAVTPVLFLNYGEKAAQKALRDPECAWAYSLLGYVHFSENELIGILTDPDNSAATERERAAMALARAVMPQNEGTIRPIDIKAREGSFFKPKFPSPSGGRAILQIRIRRVERDY